VTKRAGTDLDGRWFSNFNWIRPNRPPFKDVGFSRILGFESAAIAPKYVIESISPEEFDDVLSGITLGWLNRNGALAAQMRSGAGKVLITTYRFDKYGRDPYATYLLDSLLRYMSEPEFLPLMQMVTNRTSSGRISPPSAAHSVV
jgi:hypothetical protein